MQEQVSLQIRDLSEALPKPRAEGRARSKYDSTGRRGDLGLGSRMAAEPDEDFVFVDEQEVQEKSKIDVEVSGVAWKISQHRRSKPVGMRGRIDGIAPTIAPPSGLASGSGSRPAVVKEEERNGAGSDDDVSPPRPGRTSLRLASDRSDARLDNDSDLSPPRQQSSNGAAGKGKNGVVASPVVKKSEVKEEIDRDDDFSPPRPTKEASARTRNQGRADSDVSPPRVRRAKAEGSLPPDNKRHDSDSDLSPPRQQAKGSPPPDSKRHDSDSDLSPPRQQVEGNPPPDRKRHDSDSDLSPPRQQADEPERMSSGLKAGLVRGSDLKEEAAQVRAERRAAVLAAPDEQTGRGAATVYRNREGARIGREEWVEQQQKKRRKKISDYPEQELEWGGGVKQKYNKEQEMAEVERIAAQPFARYQPDEKYMDELREKQDWNDPMRKFQEEDNGSAGATGGAAASRVNRPRCPHAPWPNRFNIAPGYRWDGKVRGTEFEKRWLETKNHREFEQKERWKYEMEEM